MQQKIGILTYHSSDNFGSVLQAYALSKYLNLQGVDCQIIDYRKPEVKKLYEIFQPLDSRYAIMTNIYKSLYYLKLNNRKLNFELFRQNYLPLSKMEYCSSSELDDSNYDCYIVGSDQVWNTNIIDFDSSFVLDFTNKKRIAYAASCGSISSGTEGILQHKDVLDQFSAISLRESETVERFKNEGIPDVMQVCDPVFLLTKSEWEKIIPRTINITYDYMLCYFPGGVSPQMEIFSRELARKKGLKRILLMPEWRNIFRSGVKMYDAAPIDFLELIYNAKIVCTTSFHGTAFSVIFDKEFYVEAIGGDERICSLLHIAGKEGQMIKKSEDNRANSDDLLRQLIQVSYDYLKENVVNTGGLQ